MEITVLKLYRSLYCRSCILSVSNFRVSKSFIRNEHLGIKISESHEEKKILPNKLSTLYVPGRYGASMYQIVRPLIDVNVIENNIGMIIRSCQLRGIELGFESKSIISLLKEWETLKSRFADIVAKDHEYLTEQNRLKSLNLAVELEHVMKEHNEVIDMLKKEKEKLHDIEDIVFPIIQKIPNYIHESSPIDWDTVEVKTEVPDLGFEAASHVTIGMNMSMLKFSQVSPSAYYLMGKLAELELALQASFYDKFRDLDYSPMSCTDFCKSFVIEAIGLDSYLPEDCIPLKAKNHRDIGQKLNLVGGASFASFCAYFTNMNIGRSTLPAKYFALGRNYNARHRQVESPTLFSVVQSSNVHCVVLCEVTEENSEFDACFSELVSFYISINIPFRTVVLGARNLNSAESRRKQIELWSPACQKYIPVAYLSQRGDFVSKRLHITFGQESLVQGHCSILEGIAVNFPVLIGCLIENFQNPDLTCNLQEISKCSV